jgi:hypothetical protein
MLFRKTLASMVLLAVSSAQPAQAAGCIHGYPTVEQEFLYAQYVVTGITTNIKKNVYVRLPYGKGFYESRVMVQTFSVHNQYKGASRRTITHKDEYSSAQFPMVVGKKYILFYRKRQDGELYIDVCGNSRELTKSQMPLLREIGRLASRK